MLAAAPLVLAAAGMLSRLGAGDDPPVPPPDSAAPADAPAPGVETEPEPSPTDQPPLDPLPPTTVQDELDEIPPGVAIKRELDRIAAETNLRFGIANTWLFQQASGGPGLRSAASGDLDLLARWTAIGAGTKDTGVLALAAEYRYQIGDQAPAALGSQIGTLLSTTNGFSERPMVIKEAYWDQRLADDRFRYGVGRIDPENLFGGHRLQSANMFFLNKALSSNPTVAYPGPGAAAAAQIKPVAWAYISGGITDANGKATVGNLEGFFDAGEFFTFAEFALTPEFEGVGAGRYRLALWHIDERDDAGKPSDQGVTISLDQDLGESLVVFLRYGHADGDATGVTNSLQGGAGIKGVLQKDDMFGLAAAWSEPSGDGRRDEKVIEVFQRFQVTETTQFTVGVETIFDPSNAPDDDVIGVFSARLRIVF